MEPTQDNVLHMDGYRKPGDGQAPVGPAAHKDLGKPALLVGLLALALMAVFFFGLSSNMKGLSEEVRQVTGLKSELAALQAQMTLVQTQPTEGSRKLLVNAMIEDMAQKAAFLGGLIQDQEQAARMAQVQESLRLIQHQLAQ